MRVTTPKTQSTPLAGPARRIGGPEPTRRPDNPDSFGVAPINPGLKGRALEGFGDDMLRVSRIMEATENRIATTEAEEANVAFNREVSETLFNPENGYFNKKGRTAYDMSADANEQIASIRDKYSSTLENNKRAQGMFVSATETQVIRTQQDIMRHASREFDAWESATVQSRITNTLENASLYWNDPKKLAVELELGRQSVIDFSKSQGMDGATIAEQLKQFNSKFAVNMVDAALGENAAAGQVALAENAEMLQGTDIVRLQNKVDKQFQTEKLQMNTEAAITAGRGLVDEYGEDSDARTAINNQVDLIGDPELRELTRREANSQLNLLHVEKSERRAATFEAGQKAILEDNMSVAQFIASNPEAWEELSPSQRGALQKQAPIVSDAALLSDLMLLPPDKLAKITPSDYVDRLSGSDIAKLTTAVKGLRNGDPEAQVGRTRISQTTATIDRLFGPAAKRTNDQKDRVNMFHMIIDAEEKSRANQLGRNLNSTEYTDILNGMTRTVEMDRKAFGFFPVTDELGLESIPTEELMPLSQELNSRGIPVSADNLVRTYRQYLKQQGGN